MRPRRSHQRIPPSSLTLAAKHQLTALTFNLARHTGKLFVTGGFAKDYAETTVNLKAAATKERAIVRAKVSSAGVVQASTTQVEVLLYVNQYRRNVNITGEKVDQNRVVLALVPVDGE
jgi:Mce-associated membrane protein